MVSPDLGAIRPYVPCWQAICNPVGMIFLSPGWILDGLLANMSCPAECGVPFSGIVASSFMSFIRVLICGVVSFCHWFTFMYHSPFRGYSGMVVVACLLCP